MSRITKAFEGKKAFIPFITGGDPDIQTTAKLILAMAEAGAGLIQLGIPFSDPVAEGVVIQEADERALQNGCTTDKIFEMVKEIRQKTEAAICFMTYLNPVYTYGKERFLNECSVCGVDGLIIPDMPFEEKDELSGLCEKYSVDLISMIGLSSEDRTEMIASEAEGFVYCVAPIGATGVRADVIADIKKLVERIKRVKDIPCAVNFNITAPEQAKIIAAVCDGITVDSAVVKLVAKYGQDSMETVKLFTREMTEALID